MSYNLLILGEAAKRLRDLDSDAANYIEGLHEMIAVRNLLIHEYDIVDIEQLWDIAAHDIPHALADIERHVQRLDDPPPST